jgi:hypothetical protein
MLHPSQYCLYQIHSLLNFSQIHLTSVQRKPSICCLLPACKAPTFLNNSTSPYTCFLSLPVSYVIFSVICFNLQLCFLFTLTITSRMDNFLDRQTERRHWSYVMTRSEPCIYKIYQRRPAAGIAKRSQLGSSCLGRQYEPPLPASIMVENHGPPTFLIQRSWAEHRFAVAL